MDGRIDGCVSWMAGWTDGWMEMHSCIIYAYFCVCIPACRHAYMAQRRQAPPPPRLHLPNGGWVVGVCSGFGEGNICPCVD